MSLRDQSHSEFGEGLPRTEDVIVTWTHMLNVSPEKLSQKLDMEIKPENIVAAVDSPHPLGDSLDFYLKLIESTIQERGGVPKAIVVSDITANEGVDWDGTVTSVEPPARHTKDEITEALQDLSSRYGTDFYTIDPIEIIE